VFLNTLLLILICRYIPSGTSKFGAFTIENVAGESQLQYRLFIDGEEAWNKTIVAPPMPAQEVASQKIESESENGSIWGKVKFGDKWKWSW
jgi:hypothetical protein